MPGSAPPFSPDGGPSRRAGHRDPLWLRGGRRHSAPHLYDPPRINLLYFLPTAALALPAHVKNGFVEKKVLLPAILSGLLTAALTSWAATALDVELLHRLFGYFLLYVGLSELFRKPSP